MPERRASLSTGAHARIRADGRKAPARALDPAPWPSFAGGREGGPGRALDLTRFTVFAKAGREGCPPPALDLAPGPSFAGEGAEICDSSRGFVLDRKCARVRHYIDGVHRRGSGPGRASAMFPLIRDRSLCSVRPRECAFTSGYSRGSLHAHARAHEHGRAKQRISASVSAFETCCADTLRDHLNGHCTGFCVRSSPIPAAMKRGYAMRCARLSREPGITRCSVRIFHPFPLMSASSRGRDADMPGWGWCGRQESACVYSDLERVRGGAHPPARVHR